MCTVRHIGGSTAALFTGQAAVLYSPASRSSVAPWVERKTQAGTSSAAPLHHAPIPVPHPDAPCQAAPACAPARRTQRHSWRGCRPAGARWGRGRGRRLQRAARLRQGGRAVGWRKGVKGREQGGVAGEDRAPPGGFFLLRSLPCPACHRACLHAGPPRKARPPSPPSATSWVTKGMGRFLTNAKVGTTNWVTASRKLQGEGWRRCGCVGGERKLEEKHQKLRAAALQQPAIYLALPHDCTACLQQRTPTSAPPPASAFAASAPGLGGPCRGRRPTAGRRERSGGRHSRGGAALPVSTAGAGSGGTAEACGSQFETLPHQLPAFSRFLPSMPCPSATPFSSLASTPPNSPTHL